MPPEVKSARRELIAQLEEMKRICAICGSQFEGHGHNPAPVAKGRCCTECNLLVVLPARLRELGK